MPSKMTTRDIEIVKYVDEYGFITFSQAYKIWFSDCNYGYDVARRRLKAICDLGYLRVHKTKYDTFFFIDEVYFNPSEHMILAMDVYAELSRIGCKFLYFKREQSWLSGARKSDVFTVFQFDNLLYSLCVEVLQGTAINNSPSSYNKTFNQKYKQICSDGEPQAIFKQLTNYDNTIPSILIVDTRLDFRKDEWKLPDFNTHSVNEKLSKIAKVLI